MLSTSAQQFFLFYKEKKLLIPDSVKNEEEEEEEDDESQKEAGKTNRKKNLESWQISAEINSSSFQNLDEEKEKTIIPEFFSISSSRKITCLKISLNLNEEKSAT